MRHKLYVEVLIVVDVVVSWVASLSPRCPAFASTVIGEDY